MTEMIKPRKINMWEFFDENPNAVGTVEFVPIDELSVDNRKVAEFFISTLAGCENVLDIGCGPGMPGLYIAPHVDRLVALDAAPNMINVAKGNVEKLGLMNVSFEVGSAEKLPFDNASFDGASLCGVLESMEWGSVHEVMAEVSRVLKPGGRIAILDTDWSQVLTDYPQQTQRIRYYKGQLVLQVLERFSNPLGERNTRYFIDPVSELYQQVESQADKATLDADIFGADKLHPTEVLEAWYFDTAQFDTDTMQKLLTNYGFSNIEITTQILWNDKILLATAVKLQ